MSVEGSNPNATLSHRVLNINSSGEFQVASLPKLYLKFLEEVRAIVSYIGYYLARSACFRQNISNNIYLLLFILLANTLFPQNDIDPSIYSTATTVPRYVRINPRNPVSILHLELQFRKAVHSSRESISLSASTAHNQNTLDQSIPTPSDISISSTDNALIRNSPDVLRDFDNTMSSWGLPLLRPTALPGVYSLPGILPIKYTDAYNQKKIYGIDLSSIIAAASLGVSHGDQVLDMCCAPGAKLALLSDLTALGDACLWEWEDEFFLSDSLKAIRLSTPELEELIQNGKVGKEKQRDDSSAKNQSLFALSPFGTVTGVDIEYQRISTCKSMITRYQLPNVRLFATDGCTFDVPAVQPRTLAVGSKAKYETGKMAEKRETGRNELGHADDATIDANIDANINVNTIVGVNGDVNVSLTPEIFVPFAFPPVWANGLSVGSLGSATHNAVSDLCDKNVRNQKQILTSTQYYPETTKNATLAQEPNDNEASSSFISHSSVQSRNENKKQKTHVNTILSLTGFPSTKSFAPEEKDLVAKLGLVLDEYDWKLPYFPPSLSYSLCQDVEMNHMCYKRYLSSQEQSLSRQYLKRQKKEQHIGWKGPRKTGVLLPLSLSLPPWAHEENLERNLGGYDRVIVDAECTHDGSLKHVLKFVHEDQPDTQPKVASFAEKRFFEDSRLETLPLLQRRLLYVGFQHLKEGGEMIYSTCSLSRRQNEDVAAWLLRYVFFSVLTVFF